MVGKGIEEAFFAKPTHEDLLHAFQQIAILNKKDGDEFNLNEKLKISLWVISTILKYEGDVKVNIRKKIKEFWKKSGFNKIIL